MIDSHCHLADAAYSEDLDEVVARAVERGVTRALCIISADDADEAVRAGRVAQRWPAVRFSLGAHPHQAGEFAGRVPELEPMLRAALGAPLRISAIGEIGLDYHYDLSPRDVQREVFGRQVELARELDLPIVVHTREADADTLAILEDQGRSEVRGVFHCFSGPAALAERALKLGFCISFSGIVTFPKAEAMRKVAAAVPLDRLLVETDCPYLAPVPHRGKRNEPAWVLQTAAALAQAKGIPIEELDAHVSANFDRLFGRTPVPRE